MSNLPRSVKVSLMVVAGVVGLGTIGTLAVNVPRYLESHRQITVIFRDAQGIQAGTAVRVAGLEVGRVKAVQWADQDGILRARATLEVPERLAKTLRQDVQVTVSGSLTGRPIVNITSTGASKVPLVEGQEIKGLESTPLEPLLGQIGLGTSERDSLRGTISDLRLLVGEMRNGVNAGSPTSALNPGSARDLTEQIRPDLIAFAGQMKTLSAHLNSTLPALEKGLADTFEHIDIAVTKLTTVVDENRAELRSLLAGLQGASKHSAENQKALAALLGENRVAIDRMVQNLLVASDDYRIAALRIKQNPWLLTRPLSEEDRKRMEAVDLGYAYYKYSGMINDSAKRLQMIKSEQNDPATVERLNQELGSLDQAIIRFEQTEQAIRDQLGLKPPRSVPQVSQQPQLDLHRGSEKN